MESERNNPAQVWRVGGVQLAVWFTPRVEGDAVIEVASIKIDRSYRDGKEQKYTTSLRARDLLDVALLATEAYKYLRMRPTQPNACEEEE